MGVYKNMFFLTWAAALMGGLVLWLFYYRLRKNHKENNAFFHYFQIFALSNGFFYMLFGLPLLLTPNNSFLIGLGYLIGHAFGYVAYAYLIRATLLIAKPSFDSRFLFVIYLVMGLALTTLNAIFFNQPIIIDGLIDWKQNEVVGILIIIFCMIAFVPAAIVFIREAILQPKNRKRYLLIGLALLLVIISGPIHGVATVETLGSATIASLVLFIADLATIVAYLMLFMGVSSSPKTVIVPTQNKNLNLSTENK